MNFCHLHVHSHYSLLDGLIKIDPLVKRTKELGMNSLALTDHGTMYGIIEFYQKCKKAGIKPIVGVEAYMGSNGRLSRGSRGDEERYHIILLAKNEIGYKNLIKLVSLSHVEGFYYKPRIDFELLEKYHEGLIATSACIAGQISKAILRKQNPDDILKKYLNIFGDDFYLELQHHPNLQEQHIVNNGLIELSKKFGVPLTIGQDAHYLNPDDAEAHDVLICLQTKKEKSDKNRLCMLGEDFSFTDPKIIFNAFSDVPQAIENTCVIADKCNLNITLGETILPHFEVPNGLAPEQYLKKLCEEGISKKYKSSQIDDKFRKRLDYELGIINKTGYASYFLIVQDFINWAKNNKIMVGPGRGSAAGSLVAFLIGITNIDPLKYDLLFERFLNPDRISMPDIDTDFADIRRDEVIRYVESKYGKDHVGQIMTFGTMAARVSVRDVGRVMGAPYAYCDTLAKLIPNAMTLDESLTTVPELKELYRDDIQARQIIDTAKKLEGVARHSSVHACGVVITRDPLDQYAPYQYVSGDDKSLVSQYSLHPIEDLGILKMDFLGLSNLTILENAKKIVAKTKNIEIDFDNLNLEDPLVYQLMSEGRTTGVFQFESSGMKRYLKELKPNVIEDLIAMVALYRPGPLNSGMVDEFIARKNGIKKIAYDHPVMEKSLKNTYGVIVYQEQAMQLSQDMAGFTGGQADSLRKAMGKKIAALMEKAKPEFIEGCIKNKISKKIAEDTFTSMEKFAEYGFNKSHAACYALVAYWTAFMKAHYPAEFMAALLTSDQQNSDRIAIEVEECRQINIEVLPPDVNESFESFGVVPNTDSPKIRFGLMAIKNMGENIVTIIVEERKKHGPYKSLEDFLERIQDKDLNKKSMESLIKSGALDRFNDRNVLLFNLEKILNYNKRIQNEQNSKQKSLFGTTFSTANMLKLDQAPELEDKQKLKWEKELLGLYISDHPLKNISKYLEKYLKSCREVKSIKTEMTIRTGGIITDIKKIYTRKNETMLFVKIEDTTDSIELVVFPSVLQKNGEIWQVDKIIAVDGKTSNKDNEVKIICNNVKEITDQLIEKMKWAEKREEMEKEEQKKQLDNLDNNVSKINQLAPV